MHQKHRLHPAQALYALASKQFGAFVTDQALALGLSHDQLTALVRQGVIERRRRGLYVIAGAPSTHEQAAMAATLMVAGPCSTSYESAIYLHGLGPAPSRVHVTVAPTHRLRIDGVVAHRSPLPPSHRAMMGRLPVTSLPRTIVDLASVSDLDRFVETLDPLLVARRVSPARLLRVLDEIIDAPGRHGTTMLRTALGVWLEGVAPGSPAEARLLRRLAELGFDGFAPQHAVEVDGSSYYLDVAWPRRRVALEYAGAAFHGPRRWRQDEDRFDALRSVGWTLREASADDLVPGRTELWDWLRRHLG